MSNGSPTRTVRMLPGPWLAWLAAAFVLDFLLAFALSRGIWPLGPGSEMAVLGSGLAQAGVVIIFGSFWGRTWISGWLLTVACLLAGFSTMVVTEWLRGDIHNQIWYMALLLPLLALGCCSPLLAMRSWFGWTLSRSNELERNREGQRLEDLFFFSMAAAAAIMLPKTIATEIAPPPGYELVITGMVSLCSLAVVLPVAWVTFRARGWAWRFQGYFAITALCLGCLGFIHWLSASPTRVMQSTLLESTPAFVMTMLSGIWAILASGYRMTSFRPAITKPIPADTSFDQLENQETSAQSMTPSRVTVRWQTACVVAGVILSMLSVTIRDYRRVAFYKQLENPAKYFQAAVQRVDIVNHSIFGVVMAADATDEDLEKVARLAGNIESLSVAGTKFNDNSMRLLARFPRLHSLDLSKTSITDQALNQLSWKKKLSLADTHVTLDGALTYATAKGVQNLDLAGIGIDKQAIEALKSQFSLMLERLSLARNTIDDNDLKQLFSKGVHAMYLDVSDTQVDGSALMDSQGVYSINLDGTKVSDSSLLALTKSPGFQTSCLSLRRTEITPASLPVLNGYSVRLGGGKINEQDFKILARQSYPYLALNGPEFTGECLVRNIHANSIDLSESSVTDEVLNRLAGSGWVQHLQLANTQVTASGIRGLYVAELDLRGTKISADDVMRLEWNGGIRIMRHESFRPENILKAGREHVQFDRPVIFDIPW